VAGQDTMEFLPEALVPLRNSPVQARSTARLTALLDAAARVVDEIGFERLTTAMVADRAGASIGTVYRYFPDRITLLQALGARNLDRVLSRVTDAAVDTRHSTWRDAVDAAFGVLLDAFDREPGFRSLRVGDVIDLRPAPNERTFNSIVADRILEGLVERFGVADSNSTRTAVQAAVELFDALAARAFARDPHGDKAFIALANGATYSLLAEQFGTVAR